MTEIERNDTMENINESTSRKISIGDKLWLIEEIDQIGWMGNMKHNHHGVLLSQPYDTRVVAIIQTENGLFYQVRNECTISASNIGTIAFRTKEEALEELCRRRKDLMDKELVIENINVGDVLISRGDRPSRVVCVEKHEIPYNKYSYVKVVDEYVIKHRTKSEISTKTECIIKKIDYYTAKDWLVVQKKKYDISTYPMIEVHGER